MTENERFQSDINAGLKSICGPYAQAISVEDPPDPEMLAATDGKTVYICRRDHPFIIRFPKARIYQAILRGGLGYHEMGHIAYTDFKGTSDFFDREDKAARELDELWDPDTQNTYREQINALGRETVENVRRKILFEIAYNIMNVCEDGHLERRLLEETSSNGRNPYVLFANRTENVKIQRGLNFMRLVFMKSLAGATPPTGKGSEMAKAINAMLSMALYGKLIVSRGNTGDTRSRYGTDYLSEAAIYHAILPRSAKTRLHWQISLIREFLKQTNIRSEYLEMVSDALKNIEEQKKAMQNQSGNWGESQTGSKGEGQSGKDDQGQSGSKDGSQSGKDDQGQSGSKDGSQSGKDDQGQSGSKDGSQSGKDDQGQSGSKDGSQSGKDDQGQSGSKDGSQNGKEDQGQSGSGSSGMGAGKGQSQPGSGSGENGRSQSENPSKNLDTNPVPKELRNQTGSMSREAGETRIREEEWTCGFRTEAIDEKGISQHEIDEALKEEKSEREQLVEDSYKVIIPPADYLEEEIPVSPVPQAVLDVLRRSFLRCKQSSVSRCNYPNNHLEVRIGGMRKDELLSNNARKISAPLIGQLQNLLEQESREGRNTGAYAGVELDMESVFSPFPCGPFAEESNPEMKLDTAATILVDSSGSMQCNGIGSAKIAAMVLYQICNQLAIPVTIGTYNYNYTHICAAGFPGEDARCVEDRIANIMPSGGTYEPPFVLWQGNCLIKRPESRKLMFIICDGEPSDPGPAELCATARYLAANRVEVFVAGIGSAKSRIKSIYGEKCFIDITNPSEMGVQLPRILMDSLQSVF